MTTIKETREQLTDRLTSEFRTFLKDFNGTTCLGDYLQDCEILEAIEDNNGSLIEDTLNENNAYLNEFIYNDDAMDYLKENDPSLMESLAIASEMGFDASNINSCVLADLLEEQNNRAETLDYESKIQELYDELEEFDSESEEEEEEIEQLD